MTASPATADALRQMLAALEAERQALAALDIDALSLAMQAKEKCCAALQDATALDPECRALATAARGANEVNRRVRNLVAANVAARLDALTGTSTSYRHVAMAKGGYSA